MEVLQIKTVPHKALYQPAQKVSASKLKSQPFQKLTRNLLYTLEQQPSGVGLAANQVGRLWRVFVINVELQEGQLLKQTFINPKITKTSQQTEVDWEGCLSVPDTWGEVKRHTRVTVKAQNLSGEEFEVNAYGFYARLLQHEIDHLGGILFIDKLVSSTLSTQEFDKLKKRHRSI